jgi:tripeptide aminopeptidase
MTSAPSIEFTDADREKLLARFLRYVAVDTASSETSETFPSTPGQWDLLRMLRDELEGLGCRDVLLDDNGYLFATIPSNLPAGTRSEVVGYLAHVDTYGGTSGANVRAQVIRDYRGGSIPLPGVQGLVLKVEDNPTLSRCIGHTLITTDGTTLLGADDKAGVAAIVSAAEWLNDHPEIPHGDIRLGFTPDEETGSGTRLFNVERFGAKAAYTFDGSTVGEVEDETFCGDSATVTVTGFDVHPGRAKGVMVNALRAAGHLLSILPSAFLPETTDGREPYLHPITASGDVSKVVIRFIVRGFTVEDLEAREQDLLAAARETEAAFPGARLDVDFVESYRNMKVVLDRHPEVLDLAFEAIRRTGAEPVRTFIRGGTDGSALCFKGLPTPNLFTGGANFHGVMEWASLDWMAKAVETALHLAVLWGERRGTQDR